MLFAREDVKHTILAERLVMQSNAAAEKGEVTSLHVEKS